MNTKYRYVFVLCMALVLHFVQCSVNEDLEHVVDSMAALIPGHYNQMQLSKNSLLPYAQSKDWYALVEKIIDTYPAVVQEQQVQDKDFKNPFMHDCIFQFLLSKGVSPQKISQLLVPAVTKKHVDVVACLVWHKDFVVDFTDACKTTVPGCITMYETLFSDVYTKKDYAVAAVLCEAYSDIICERYGAQVVQAFVARQYITPYARNKNGQTLLHVAVENNDLNFVEYLIKAGVDINARDAEGDTPLHVACMDDGIDEDVFLELLWNKADLSLKNKDGHTPVDIVSFEKSPVKIEKAAEIAKWIDNAKNVSFKMVPKKQSKEASKKGTIKRPSKTLQQKKKELGIGSLVVPSNDFKDQ